MLTWSSKISVPENYHIYLFALPFPILLFTYKITKIIPIGVIFLRQNFCGAYWAQMLLDFIFYILGVFRGNPKQVKEYQDLLTPVLHHTTEGIVGMLFQDILSTSVSLMFLWSV